MVHFIPFWSFRNNVLQEHKGKWTHRWAINSVRQHVGGKVHSGCRQNIRCVRLHLLLCSVFLRKGGWRTAATIGAEGTREAQPWELQPVLQAFPVIWPLLLFSHHLSFVKGIWGIWKVLSWLPLEVGWAGLTVILGSQIPREIWGLLSVAYNSSGLVYIGNYSETDIEVVQIHTLHKSALTCKSAQAFMLYYLSKGDNWCEISKGKTP